MGEESNWLITPRDEMTPEIEIENEELQPLMNMAKMWDAVGGEGPESEEPANEPENEEPANDGPENNPPPPLPHTLVPKDSPIENTLASYILPFRHNRWKPPNRYSLYEEERRSKYPISNYVTTQALSKPIKTLHTRCPPTTSQVVLKKL